MNPATSALLNHVRIDAKMVVMMMMIMLVIPVTVGILIRTRRPDLASKIRTWVRRLSMLVFSGVATAIIAMNLGLLLDYSAEALFPVLSTFTIAACLGWGLAWLSRLRSAQRRAVTLEVAMQNVALAIGTAVAFFPSHAGVAVTAALWGVVHLTCGFALTSIWAQRPTGGKTDVTPAYGSSA